MPELLAKFLAEFEQGVGAVANNNPVADMTAGNIENELWRALRQRNLDRFQFLLNSIARGNQCSLLESVVRSSLLESDL